METRVTVRERSALAWRLSHHSLKALVGPAVLGGTAAVAAVAGVGTPTDLEAEWIIALSSVGAALAWVGLTYAYQFVRAPRRILEGRLLTATGQLQSLREEGRQMASELNQLRHETHRLSHVDGALASARSEIDRIGRSLPTIDISLIEPYRVPGKAWVEMMALKVTNNGAPGDFSAYVWTDTDYRYSPNWGGDSEPRAKRIPRGVSEVLELAIQVLTGPPYPYTYWGAEGRNLDGSVVTQADSSVGWSLTKSEDDTPTIDSPEPRRWRILVTTEPSTEPWEGWLFVAPDDWWIESDHGFTPLHPSREVSES